MAILDPLDIVNAACAVFGDGPLESLDDDNFGGQPASLIYEMRIEFNLGIYPWTFGRQLFQMSRDDTANAWAGYSYVYDLPPQRLGAPIYLTDDVTDAADHRFSAFQLEGDNCHTNATALWAMCKYSVPPHRWSGAFKSATVTALAADLARARAHDKTLARDLYVQAYGTPSESYRGGEIGAAIRADSFGTPPRPQNRADNPLEVARFS